VLEYKEDLSSYYKHSYGSALNKDVGCPAVKDFIDRFRYDLGDLLVYLHYPIRLHSMALNLLSTLTTLFNDIFKFADCIVWMRVDNALEGI
jgi:hypothetical protein